MMSPIEIDRMIEKDNETSAQLSAAIMAVLGEEDFFVAEKIEIIREMLDAFEDSLES